MKENQSLPEYIKNHYEETNFSIIKISSKIIDGVNKIIVRGIDRCERKVTDHWSDTGNDGNKYVPAGRYALLSRWIK